LEENCASFNFPGIDLDIEAHGSAFGLAEGSGSLTGWSMGIISYGDFQPGGVNYSRR
jgi:hypothetical protein